MDNSSQEFIKEFKEVEEFLNSLINFSRHLSFPELVAQSSKYSAIVREYRYDILRFSDIRNILVHGEEMVQVTKEAQQKIAKINRLLQSPPTVSELFSKKVTYCQIEDNLEAILKIMKENIFTHIPVYKDGKFFGVLSESSVTSWLADKIDSPLNLRSCLVQEMALYLKNRPEEVYKFVNKDTSVYEVRDWFLEFAESGNRLGAVLITPTGGKDELLLGIITAWDIPKIKELL